ncbi:MAG TPA: TAXI family TRAP transporter solute-binding subunit [Micromonosporaceae bacterium]|jgi:hypothetical protein
MTRREPGIVRRLPRRWRWVAAIAVVVLIGVAGWVASPWPPRSAPRPAGPVVLAAGEVGGVSHLYSEELGAAFGGAPGAFRTVTTDGSRDSLDLLAGGGATFALATADVVAAYLAAHPTTSIRAVARLYDSYVHLVVAADGPVHRPADLRGARVAVGTPGSGWQQVADQILDVAGIDPGTDITRFDLGPQAAATALAARQIDAFFLVDAMPSPELTGTTGGYSYMHGGAIRLVDLADVADQLPASENCPGSSCAAYHTGTVPAQTYPSLAVAITTVAMPTLLLTAAAVSDELVGRITALVFASAPRIAADLPAVRQIDRHGAIFTGAVPLHEGAAAYYRATKVFAFAPLP